MIYLKINLLHAFHWNLFGNNYYIFRIEPVAQTDDTVKYEI